MFKVGDVVRRVRDGSLHGVKADFELTRGSIFVVKKVLHKHTVVGKDHYHFEGNLELVTRESPTARRNDQATSRGSVPKGMQYDVWKVIEAGRGFTGHEIAIALGGIHLLNSVTPRLAPLRRAGLIKDSGTRRERQIVWTIT